MHNVVDFLQQYNYSINDAPDTPEFRALCAALAVSEGDEFTAREFVFAALEEYPSQWWIVIRGSIVYLCLEFRGITNPLNDSDSWFGSIPFSNEIVVDVLLSWRPFAPVRSTRVPFSITTAVDTLLSVYEGSQQ